MQRYLIISLASFAALLYEVLLTRITSAVLLYHFTFLALSLAMLGLGAPGVWFAFWPQQRRTLRRSLVIAGLGIPLSVVAIFKIGALLSTPVDGLPLLSILVIVAGLVPLLALGAAICILLTEATERGVARMYAADLIGAATGAALVIPAMDWIGTPQLIALAGLAPLGAALLLGGDPRLPLGSAALIAGLLLWGEPLELRFNRVYQEDGDLLYERWTATGRVTIHAAASDPQRPFHVHGWGWGRAHRPTLHDELWIHQEGDAGTPITRLEDSPESLHFLDEDVTSVGYQIVRPARVAVIGSGGGRDVLTALRAGALDIDAVELNPEILGAVTGPFREFSGDVYGRPGVHPIVSEGRSFLTRSRGDYDLIQISMVDSWAATSAGAYALSENYLYTLEAMRLYLDRLSDGGVASIVRWYAEESPIQSVRLALLAARALKAHGMEDPLAHLAVVQASRAAVVLMFKQPMSDATRAALDRVSRERGFTRQFPPRPAAMPPSMIAAALSAEPMPEHINGHDVSATTDDRPFFFQTASLFADGESLGFTNQSAVLLRRLMIAVATLTLALFFLPFLLMRRIGQRGELWRGTGYFAAIGCGFMLVEAPMIQQVILLLGHPSYATTVVLAVILAGAGTGSYCVSRMPTPMILRLYLAIPAGLLVAAATMPWITQVALSSSFPIRVTAAAALLAPMGFLMGMGFPAGMRRFGRCSRAWLWAVNGALSVMGSVLSLVVAMAIGFKAVTAMGAGFYLIAYALIGRGSTTVEDSSAP